MADWLPGVTKAVAGQATGSFDSEANPTWKLGLHTTEGFSIAGAEAAYRNGGYWPHITVGVTDFDDWKFGVHQHFPFWSRSTTFADGSGGIRTNRDYVIQVEIVGTCDDSWKTKQGGKYKKLHVDHWPDDYARYVAGVLKAIMQHRPIPNRTSVTWARYPASYGQGAKQRLSTAAYDGYSGILGHQHVPENTHGDPGNLLPFLQKYVLPSAPKPPAPTPKPVPPVEEPMANPARLVQVKGQDAVYAVTLSGAVHIKNPTHLTHLRESGQVAWPPKEITAAALAQLLEKE